MIELLRRFKSGEHDPTILESVANLAAKEREVRTLELLIEHLSSLEDNDLERAWPRLFSAFYTSPAPDQAPGIAKNRDER